jgi:hypothetical protein
MEKWMMAMVELLEKMESELASVDLSFMFFHKRL